MKIRFKLYAGLDAFLPAHAENHAVTVEVADDSTAHALIDLFGVPRERAHLVLVNGEFLRPEQRDQPLLRDGDTLAVWPPVAGG